MGIANAFWNHRFRWFSLKEIMSSPANAGLLPFLLCLGGVEIWLSVVSKEGDELVSGSKCFFFVAKYEPLNIGCVISVFVSRVFSNIIGR